METYFKERQRFRQTWVWGILIACLLICIYPLLMGVDMNLAIIISLITVGAAILLFAFMQLTVKVDAKGVSYRYFPFQWQYRQHKWEDLKNYYVRKYNPIWEYGGWGVRFNRFGKAYTVRGRYGLHLEFPDGRHILVGTQRREALERAIAQTKKKDPTIP